MSAKPDTSLFSVPVSQIGENRHDVTILGTHTEDPVLNDPLVIMSQFMKTREAEMNADAIQHTSRIDVAVQLGKQILTYAIPHEFRGDMSDMKVQFLDPDKWQIHIKRDSEGLMVAGMDTVYVKLIPTYPDHYAVLTAIHELTHRWTEKRVILHAEKLDLENQQRTSYFKEKRHGLIVDTVVRSALTGEVTFRKSGELLNELGSWGMQLYYWRILINSSQLQQLFIDELDFRKNCLDHRHERNQGWTASQENLTITEGDVTMNFQVILDRENMLFSNDGAFIAGSATLGMQLFSEIASRYDNDDQSLLHDVIAAKLNPKAQNILRARLDQIFGKGFYRYFKQLSNEGIAIATVLGRVQQTTRGTSNQGQTNSQEKGSMTDVPDNL